MKRIPIMPSRTKTNLPASQLHYLRKKGSTKVTLIYSPELLEEMLADGRITEEDHVGIQRTKEGLGGNRGKESEKKEVSTRPNLSIDCPWTYCSQSTMNKMKRSKVTAL